MCAVAAAIHELQINAYQQEAQLIEAKNFPPLRITIDEVLDSKETFYGIFDSERLAGVIAVELCDSSVRISSLAVASPAQRKGVGSALVSHTVARYANSGLWVMTATLNTPAILLYHKLGFKEIDRLVSTEHIALVKLEWPKSAKARAP